MLTLRFRHRSRTRRRPRLTPESLGVGGTLVVAWKRTACEKARAVIEMHDLYLSFSVAEEVQGHRCPTLERAHEHRLRSRRVVGRDGAESVGRAEGVPSGAGHELGLLTLACGCWLSFSHKHQPIHSVSARAVTTVPCYACSGITQLTSCRSLPQNYAQPIISSPAAQESSRQRSHSLSRYSASPTGYSCITLRPCARWENSGRAAAQGSEVVNSDTHPPRNDHWNEYLHRRSTQLE